MRCWCSAARAHQLLQDYLLDLLVREGDIPTLDEILDRADDRTGWTVSVSQTVRAVRDDRESR